MVYFNASDYGFSRTGNGKENTAALQRAIDGALASGSGTVVLLAGDFQVEGSIAISGSALPDPPGSVRIVGSDGTKLLQATDEPVFVIGSEDTVDAATVTIENLHIEGKFQVSEEALRDSALEETR